MASLIYNSAVRDEAVGNIDFDTDTFYGMLVTSTYTPNKDTHTKRSDVTNEVTGTGYTAGGMAVSEAKAQTVIALPMHPYLSTADQDQVIDAIRGFNG
mgnify:CR=1 FL=1